jgi:adenine-specific DNA-methyltransferase
VIGELLGRVFENLLAAYNPETGATARKQTGSFYAPRAIVNYMVDDSLISCLKTKLEAAFPGAQETEPRVRQLFEYNHSPHRFTGAEADVLIAAIDCIKVLEPACGSGAVPMGVLHKLVFVLGKLDPGNQGWNARQMAKAREIPDAVIRERADSGLKAASCAGRVTLFDDRQISGSTVLPEHFVELDGCGDFVVA